MNKYCIGFYDKDDTGDYFSVNPIEAEDEVQAKYEAWLRFHQWGSVKHRFTKFFNKCEVYLLDDIDMVNNETT